MELLNDLFDLNIWWNLNILRDTLRRATQLNLIPWSPTRLSRAYASTLFITQKPATSPTPLRSENHASWRNVSSGFRVYFTLPILIEPDLSDILVPRIFQALTR